jgi:hypothetical protein
MSNSVRFYRPVSNFVCLITLNAPVISPKRLTSVSTRKGGDDLAMEVAGGVLSNFKSGLTVKIRNRMSFAQLDVS